MRILFSSPEAALGQHRKLIEDLASRRLIVGIAIDEAHCVLKYGYSKKTKSGKIIKAFRKDYRRLTELRAILGRIPMVALTATLMKDSQTKLMKDLNMKPCFSLIMPPKKDNIKYIVHKLQSGGELEDHFEWLVKLLQVKKVNMAKTLIFFHKIAKQGEAYEYLDDELKEIAHVGQAPFSDASHVFEMYHMRTDDQVKETIIKQFAGEGHMRCVLASSSFSMGLDIDNIELVIHYGSAMDIDDFLQETGRASRQSHVKATSIVLLYPRCLCSQHISSEMKEVLRTKTCRRESILKHYMESQKPVFPLHDCCDNCSKMCDCKNCPPCPLYELGILGTDHQEGEDELDAVESSDNSHSESDSDSDMEVYRRKPVMLQYDSE